MGRNNKIICGIIICSWIINPIGSNAQQNALYSQYMFNPFSINPAYAGSRQSMSAVLLYRNQWVGIDGAPVIQTFAMHTPLKGKRVALGINFLNETLGPRSSVAGFGTYAYHLPLVTGALSMGLRAGVYRLQVDEDMLDFKDKSDTYSNEFITGKFIPSFDFGLYYYSKSLYAGAAATHLSQGLINEKNNDFLAAQLHSHIILSGGYAHALNENIVLKPSTVIRIMQGFPVNFDINFSSLFKKVFGLGFSYRTSGDLVVIAEFNITDFLRAGYSYDILLNDVQKFSKGSHEIFIGVDFGLPSKKKLLSPRMF